VISVGKIYHSFPFQNRQRYNVTRKNMQNLVSALTNLNFQYIFLIARWVDVGFINAISPAKEALILPRLNFSHARCGSSRGY
jgi:septum formation inhibitor-activating ATPase MinD